VLRKQTTSPILQSQQEKHVNVDFKSGYDVTDKDEIQIIHIVK